jgi:hypothetical protein
MSETPFDSEINVRSDGYLIARAMGTCWYCGASTRLLALALPPGHETLAMDADPEGEQLAQDVWDAALCNAFLFYVAYLPDAVQRRLQEFSPLYRFARSAATLGSYWANHCERCGSLLDDHNLFCEPEGAFLPTSHTRAAAIRLVRIDEPLEAAAAGYACDPQFFESMRGT